MTTFPAFPTRPQLMIDEVHVVRFPLDAATDIASFLVLLDRDECRRADRFVQDRDRRRSVVSHGMTRLVLGRCLRRPPGSLRFTSNNWGKPALAGQANRLQFSLAHAGERGLLAVGLERQIGVDIEQHRPLRALDLSRRFFSPDEHSVLQSLAPDEQLPAFFRCWTRKESFLKALGAGLSFPLAGFEVSLAAHG